MAQHIIVADDESDVLEVLQKILSKAGYKVSCASRGDEAVELFKKHHADCVITDIRMPGMDGMDVLKTIKSITPNVPVIILTGHATLDMAVLALKDLGAYDFLTKPQSRSDLLRVTAMALEHGRLVNENDRLMEQLQNRQDSLEDQNQELRITQKALESSRHRYQDLYHNAPVSYVTVDSAGLIIEANHRAAELLQKKPGELDQQPFINFVAPENIDSYACCVNAIRENHSISCEITMHRTDGSKFEAQIEAKSIFDPNKGQPQTLIILSDITERKLAEVALKNSEARFRSFIQSLKGIAYQQKTDGTPIFFHGAVESITGYSIDDLQKAEPAWQELIYPNDRHIFDTMRSDINAKEEKFLSIEYRIQDIKGQLRWVREHAQNICCINGESSALQGIIFDITDYKQLQAQIMEARRLDSIATLAGGVAHQFNNALAGLVGYVELLHMDIKKIGKSSENISAIFEQVKRMANLTQQLLAYAKGGQYEAHHINLAEFVDSALSLIRENVPGNIRIETDLSTNTGFVNADTTQLQMVLLALVKNAAEATEGPGRIRVCARNENFSANQLTDHPKLTAGQYVLLEVSDEGCGMDENTLKKVFDPFFTTKFIGRGLGLSAVYGIIDCHGGWLNIESKPAKGTNVRIYLPKVQPARSPKIDPPAETSNGQGATILVVEDETQLMKAIHQRLSRLNYKPLGAATGQQATDLLESYQGVIDAVLLDMRLPDIDGDKLFHKLIAIRPNLKIILCSGYAIDEPVKKLLKAGAYGFLQKPFSLVVLSEKLTNVINSCNA
ncbi:MAG: response regulator [Desulfobacteraceae bacterium]|nr:response regulator [Desulfobacteraceae bacterium]